MQPLFHEHFPKGLVGALVAKLFLGVRQAQLSCTGLGLASRPPVCVVKHFYGRFEPDLLLRHAEAPQLEEVPVLGVLVSGLVRFVQSVLDDADAGADAFHAESPLEAPLAVLDGMLYLVDQCRHKLEVRLLPVVPLIEIRHGTDVDAGKIVAPLPHNLRAVLPFSQVDVHVSEVGVCGEERRVVENVA